MKVKSFLKKYKNACKEARIWMRKNNIQTMEEAWKKCARSDWMIWVIRKLNCADKMTWVKITLACVERVLPIYEKRGNSDASRKAIKAAEAWIKDPSEENRMKCQIAAANAANAADAAYAAYAAAGADVAYAAAGADVAYAAAAADVADAAFAAAGAVAFAAAAAAADAAAERKAQCKIIRRLVKNPFI